MIVPRCFLSWRAVPVYAPQSGEIIFILKQLMAAQKEEEDRKANQAGLIAAKEEEIATLTATIETKLARQGDLAVGWGASRMTWPTRRGPWPLTRSWPPCSPKVVAASHRSGRSARRAGLEKARLVNLAHLARHTLFHIGQPRNVAGCLHPRRPRTGCHVIHMVLCTRRSTHCGVEFLLSQDLSQVGSRSLWSRSWQTLCRRSWTVCSMCRGSACSIASWSRSWMCQCCGAWKKSWSLLLVRSSATLVQASGDSTGGRAQIEQIVDVPVQQILEQSVEVIKVILREVSASPFFFF